MSASEAEASNPPFLLGGGELGALIAGHDWSKTSLGPLAAWPQSLKTVTGMLLLSPVPIVLLWGPEGIMIYNDAYSVFAGGRHPQLLGSEVRKGWPEVADFNDNVMKVGLAGGTLAYKDQELTLYRHGGPEPVWMNLDYSPVLDESGRPAGVIAIVVETTERVRAERRVQADRERLTRLFEQAPGLMAMLHGPDHVYELANRAYLQLVGDRDLIGKPMREAQPEVARQGFVELLDEVYRTGRAYVGHGVRVALQRSADGPEETRVLDFVYQPVTGADGVVTGIFIEGYDVTERDRAERRVRQSEERFRALVTTTADVVYRMDPDWKTMRQLDGKNVHIDTQAPNPNWLADYIPADDHPRVTAAIGEAIRARSPLVLEHRIRRAGGGLGWALSRAVPLFDDQGHVTEWFGTAGDVTARRQSEEALRANEAKQTFLVTLGDTMRTLSTDADVILATTTRMLGQHLGVAVCAYADMDDDEDGFTIRGDWCAPGSSSIVGHYRLSAFGRRAVENLHAGLPLILDDVRAQLPPGEAATFLGIGLAATICMPLIKEGRLTALMAIHDKVPRRWTADELAVLSEVTERSWAHVERVRAELEVREADRRFREELEAKVAERTAALQQAQKMEAVGQLTGGIAHDFNNLLMAVFGSLELLRKRIPPDPGLLRLVDNAMEGTRRGRSLTARMLAFARRQDLKTERIDLEQLVGGMAELLQSALGAAVAVEVRFPRALPAVETDPNQLESALLNLAVNARDAMRGEGRLVIAARAAVADGRDGLKPGRYVCLSVTDTGEGMDPTTLKRATEPFFTTKGVGKGTGLGLSMVHGLAEQCGGTLLLHSAPGTGTTAEIWLPAQAAAPAPAAPAPAATPAPEPDAAPAPVAAPLPPAPEGRSSLTILAVDDDALVLMSTCEMLEDLGHRVLSAHSGVEALKLLGRNAVDLLITDHAMPHMTGAQLAAEVRSQRPDLPIILATGYAELPPGVTADDLPRLGKPYSQSDLGSAVAKATGRAGP